MDTHDIVETWRREAIKQGIKEVLIDVYEARFGAMPEELRALVDDMHDEPTLRTWAKLAGTRSADEVATTLRRSRPS